MFCTEEEGFSMFRRIILLFGVCLWCCGDTASGKTETIDDLIRTRKYGTAKVMIETAMSDAENECDSYLVISKLSAKLAEYNEAYSYLGKCIDSMPEPSVKEEKNTEIEETLDVAGAFRLRKIWSISDSIVDALDVANAGYSSIYYERAYIRQSQDDLEGFIVNYYKGYRLNPGNPRRWVGLAVINSFKNQPPSSPEDFYLLKAATFQYDNPALWGYVMQTLERYDLLSEENVKRYADSVPRHIRPIFDYYYYDKINEHKKASNAIQEELRSDPGEVPRRVLFLAHLASVSGTAGISTLTNIVRTQGDFCELVFYYNYWLSYWERHEWTSDTLAYYTDFVRDVRRFLFQILPEGQTRVSYNEIVNWVVLSLIENSRPREAIDILNSSLKDLNKTNKEILVLLHKNVRDDKKAVQVIEGICRQYPDEGIARKWLIEQAVLQRETAKLERYVSLMHRRDERDAMGEYQRLIEQGISIGASKMVIDVPDKYDLSASMDWRDWEKIGPCAVHSVASILGYWGSGGNNYRAIIEDLRDEGTNGNKGSVDAIEVYIASQGFKTFMIPPIKTVMKRLLDARIPLIVFDSRSIQGLDTGHSSVAYGYDDLQKVFVLKDTSSGIGESSVGYDDIVEARFVLVAVPSSRDMEKGLHLAELDAIARKKIIKQTKIEELEERFLGVSRWCYFHNGESLYKQNDAGALKYLERALDGKKPTRNLIYIYMAAACRHKRDYPKALQYIHEGLGLYPDLKLLEQKVRVRMDQIESEGLTVAIGKEMLEVAKAMERLNPEYPETYFLRGDIYARYTRNYDYVINAFVSYLRKSAAMGSPWKNEHEPFMEHAMNAISIYRKAIHEKVVKGGVAVRHAQ